MMFVASLIFERRYRSQEICSQPKSLRVLWDFDIRLKRSESRWRGSRKENWLRRGISYLQQHPDRAHSLLHHYAGFAERYGGILTDNKVLSWENVEEHTPHGFLAHLAGLGLDEQELKDAANLLFAFHFALAESGASMWKPKVAEWERSVREVLSLFEERFVLIEAIDERSAWLEAERVGKEQESVFKNPYGDEVLWQFVKINEVIHVDGKHGSEIFSRFLNSHEAKLLMQGHKILFGIKVKSVKFRQSENPLL